MENATVKTDTLSSGIRMTLADGKTVVGGQAIMAKVLHMTFHADRIAENLENRPKFSQHPIAAQAYGSRTTLQEKDCKNPLKPHQTTPKSNLRRE